MRASELKEGPDIARLGALIGDPARANMLTALMSGKALTASELAAEAGVALSTASAHLRQLEEGRMIGQRKQGRHRYFSLTGPEVAEALESLAVLAAKGGQLRTRTGPKDPALRRARACYDHLAGELGVRLFDSLKAQRAFAVDTAEDLRLSKRGRALVADFGIDLDSLEAARRPVCRPCLDWSQRRSHLAGALGAAYLTRLGELGWAKRVPDSRLIRFTRNGEESFLEAFPL